jgi:hypothetical protein
LCLSSFGFPQFVESDLKFVSYKTRLPCEHEAKEKSTGDKLASKVWCNLRFRACAFVGASDRSAGTGGCVARIVGAGTASNVYGAGEVERSGGD